MNPAFDPPKGDAGAVKSAINSLQGLAKGLASDKRSASRAIATATAEWNGARKRDFERAGAGLELRGDQAAIAVGEIADALHRPPWCLYGIPRRRQKRCTNRGQGRRLGSHS